MPRFTFQPWTRLVKIYVLFDHMNGVLRALPPVRGNFQARAFLEYFPKAVASKLLDWMSTHTHPT